MPEIRPIRDLRNTTEISELCHKNEEPIFITKNGYGDLVIMSMETYEKKLAQADLYKKLAEAESQVENGEPLLDAEDVFEKLRKKYVKE
ncbi:type II toxin-antitoxin system Phd/YefM family antitoxin [Desulfoscipio gibsoniae]|uniref:Antitoxin n=1 Tax=Desulfoscipio gibsoniae DSM 7213 TaxID=767817 RepID=R4KSU1_9FIRM|nr:type II toxin-antitoxin system Phd/YefM family antitoxin [Desulfoscipio gibsoniae]AGL03660.1 Phd_YefM [Desulfoscipio gibsoniae DSM 7213]